MMKPRKLLVIALALLIGAFHVACSDDSTNDTDGEVADAGSDVDENDTDSGDEAQDGGDAGGDAEFADARDTDATDAGDAERSDVGGEARDGGDAEPDTGVDAGADADADVPPVDDVDPTGGSWSADYSMPGLQGESGARGYVFADDPNGGFYVGGIFDVAGRASASQVAHWDGTFWNAVGATPLPIKVHALTLSSTGELYAGGEEGGGGGIGIGGANSIERWDGTSWSTWAGVGSGVGTAVYDIEILSDGRIVVGGDFDSIEGQSTQNLAVFDGADWSVLGNGDAPSGAVRVIEELSDGRICIGGDFAEIGSLTVNRIACWDGAQWQALGAGLNSAVHALLEDGGDLLVGGFFSVTDSNGDSSSGVGRWDGAEWHGVAGGVQGGSVTSVRALKHGPSGELFVGGTFTSAGDASNAVAATNIAKLDNGQWSALGSGAQNTVGMVLGAVTGVNDFLLDSANHSLLVTGLFSLAGDKFSLNIGRWQLGATDDTGWSKVVGPGEFAGADMAVVTLASGPDGTAYATGRFSTIGGKSIESIAEYSDFSWEGMPGHLSGDVADIVIDSTGTAYVGGSFTLATNSQNISNLAAWDGNSWSAVPGSPSEQVVSMAISPGDDLYVATSSGSGGDFTVQEWDGSAWQQLGAALDDNVTSMQVTPSGELYIGGQFDEDATGTALAGIARWDGAAWAEVSSGVDEMGYVRDMTIYDGKLLVVGKFDEVGGGQAAGSVALWDGTSWDSLGGGLPPRFPGGSAPTVLSVAAKANGFFVSGTFPNIDSQPVNYIAWWDGQDWHALGEGLSDFAQAMTIVDRQLIVGGVFTEAGAQPSYHIGVWSYR